MGIHVSVGCQGAHVVGRCEPTRRDVPDFDHLVRTLLTKSMLEAIGQGLRICAYALGVRIPHDKHAQIGWSFARIVILSPAH